MDTKKVLLVDDSLIVHRQFKQILEDAEEFEVVGCGKTGLEAITLFTSLKPDIVIMDMIMPDMDGFQAMRAIMELEKDAVIVVASSTSGDSENVMRALQLGAKSFLSKPLESETVLTALRGL
jgi:two-component system chemotaxis response regulator CheY